MHLKTVIVDKVGGCWCIEVEEWVSVDVLRWRGGCWRSGCW